MADSPDTAWAEWYRWLSESGLPPALGLPRALWQLRVSGDRFADLRSERGLARVGPRAPSPDRPDWPEFQAVGQRLAGEGYAGLVAPSAARKPGQVLCLFWPPRSDTSVESVGKPALVSAPPLPPRGLRT
ncbi:MAG: RES domain-containing protein [Actinomycetota bacterium]|nr:RES domain-containing protein [Actinomycetota bacterium]